jgi:formylglycine-generating enzyme required for sulfatase activity/DNA-binding protein H-NS
MKTINKFILFLIIISVFFSLNAKETQINISNINQLSDFLVKNINKNIIDNNSITLEQAKTKKDEINSQFEKESAQYRNNLLKFTIELSYLERSLAEKNSEKEELSTLVKIKKSKLEQIQQEIKNEKSYIQKLSKLLSKDINFNNNLSTQGYFVTIIKGKLSDSRDKLISKAVESITSESIPTLNGVLVETVLQYDKKLSQSIKETSSGKAIADSSDTTLKLFFTDKNRNNILIYGTKVDVYPFEVSQKNHTTKNRLKHQNKQQDKAIFFIKNKNILHSLRAKISREYSNLDKNNQFRKIITSLNSIDKHNQKSLDILNELNRNYKNSLDKTSKRIRNRKTNLELLSKQRDIFQNEIKEIQKELIIVSNEIKAQKTRFDTHKEKLNLYKNSYTFSRAEMYNRRFSNSVKEIKNIISDIVLELDKAFAVTSSKIETLYNNSEVLKDLIHSVKYRKTYVYADVIPYFVPLDNQIGAVVILRAKFTESKKNSKKYIDQKIEFDKLFNIHLPTQTSQNLNNIEQEERDILLPVVKRISAGEFTIGNPNGDSDERWEKTIKIEKDFYIGKYEVSIKEYLDFVKKTDSHEPVWLKKESPYNIHTGIKNNFKNICLEDNCPIIGITWDDAKAYTNWLSKETGQKYRLPTEAEWEYVAKAGNANLEYGFFSGKLKEYAWFSTNSENSTHLVGTKRSNIWGIYDMNGNVWEWCEDSYKRNYKLMPSNGRSYNSKDSEKVVRGGAWNATDYFIRSTNRSWVSQDSALYNLGFRIVKEIAKN